jgi:magnesium chelatase subunit H
LVRDFKGLEGSIFAAAEWGENPSALAEAKAAIEKSDIIIVNLLFFRRPYQTYFATFKR